MVCNIKRVNHYHFRILSCQLVECICFFRVATTSKYAPAICGILSGKLQAYPTVGAGNQCDSIFCHNFMFSVSRQGISQLILLNWDKPLHGTTPVLHELKENIAGSRPDRTVISFVNNHDDIWIGLKPRLANKFVDATLVVPIFHVAVWRIRACPRFCVNGVSSSSVKSVLQTGWKSGSARLSSPGLALSISC